MNTKGDIALRVTDLSVGYEASSGVKQVVDNLSFDLVRGRILALAGESGCGKSTAALAAIGYKKRGTRILGGSSVVDGTDILKLKQSELRALWGNLVAYVPQSASMSLNPGTSVGKQLAQAIKRHTDLRGEGLRDRQIELLEHVGMPDPGGALKKYPFQFSGGQQQRISLAIALSCSPSILVLDEPTTGLDVTTQARITKLLRNLVEELSISALYISHDLALLNEVADDIAVMYAGEVIERSTMASFASRPRHPYARALFDVTVGTEEALLVPGIPGTPPGVVVQGACAFVDRCDFAQAPCGVTHPPPVLVEPGHSVSCLRVDELSEKRSVGVAKPAHEKPTGAIPLLSVNSLTFNYRGTVKPTLSDVSLSLYPGERLGIVGESGSGKSTLLRVISGLEQPTAGTIELDGTLLAERVARRTKADLRAIQLIFQNPDSSLNPRQSVGAILERPIRLFRENMSRNDEQELVDELLDAVRLPASYADRFPRELSGGQRQRVAIARAFAAKPRVLLCDEVTSALDVSVQATVLELLADLAQRTGVGVVFVGHNLAVVRTIVDRAIVMRNGEIVEEGISDMLFTKPSHSYTRELVAALPKLTGDVSSMEGLPVAAAGVLGDPTERITTA